ncbi:MAG: tetratricopeptide repeat protein [Ginsengibacter sp.]
MKSFLIFLAGCFYIQLSLCQNIDSAQFYYGKGTEASKANLFAIAATNFDKAISFNSNLTDAYIENGKAALEMRMIDKANQNFSKAYELDSNNNEVIYQLATLSFNNHQFQKAIHLAQKCIKCGHTSRILGMSYYSLEDYGKAEKYLKEYIAKNAPDALVVYTLGRTYLELEDEKSAILQYQNAIDLELKSQWIYELALIYYNQDDYTNALKYFDLAQNEGYPKSNDFYENYGFAQLYSGNVENGIKTLNIVLERKPNNKELMKNIAYAMYHTKKYSEALIYFEKILNITPKDAPTLYMIGLSFQKMGQKEKGQKICDNAIILDPSLKMYRQKKEIPQGL